MSEHDSMISDALYDLFGDGGAGGITPAFSPTVIQFASGNPDLGTYPVNNFSKEAGDWLWLAIGTVEIDTGGDPGLDGLVGPFPQWCAFADMQDGWYFGNGSFDSYLNTSPIGGYNGAHFAVQDEAGLKFQAGGALGLVALGGDPGNPCSITFLLQPQAGNDASFLLFVLDPDAGPRYMLDVQFATSDSSLKLGLFGAPPVAQATHVAPGSITTAQIGQLLIDYGLMAAS